MNADGPGDDARPAGPAAARNEPEHGFLCLHEFVSAAKRKLPSGVWDYLIGATETETTAQRNRLALDSLAFRPRVLRDVAAIDPRGSFLGRPVRLPVALAPVGGLESMDPGGAASVARAAATFDVPMILSSVSEPGLEATAAAAGDGPRVFQLYVRGDAEWVDDTVRRAVDHGYDAFCLTVDTALYSRRERDIATRFVKPWRTRAQGHGFQAALNWADVARFKDRHRLPLVLKGIATAEDAAEAVRHEVEVVYVSNHGGRQLDHGRGALEVLPEVVDAVAGQARVWFDGGVCRGSDVVKAVALGAEIVAIGRLYCYGLAAAGEAGVVRVLELLEEEARTVLGLLGAVAFAEVGRAHLHPAAPTVPPGVLSAFPLLNLADRGYR